MKKILLVVLILAMAISVFAGCSAGPNMNEASTEEYYAEEAAYEKSDMDMVEQAPAPAADYDESYEDTVAGEAAVQPNEGGANIGADGESSILEPSVDRKIIYSGYISARTKNFDDDYKDVLAKVKAAGGYVENAYVEGTKPEEWQDEGRYAEITIRVPSAKFDSFISMLSGIGETTSSSVSGQDISLQYFDMETRLKTLRIREERLQDLLKKAENLEDIIDLERELANVSYEIQSFEIELRNFDSLVDFSTIRVTLREVHEVDQIVPADKTMGERIKTGWYSVMNGLAEFGRWLVIAIVVSSPVIIILGVILVIVLVSVKKARKRKLKKSQETFNQEK